MCLVGRVSVWNDDVVLEMDNGANYTTLQIYMSPNCTLKKWLNG